MLDGYSEEDTLPSTSSLPEQIAVEPCPEPSPSSTTNPLPFSHKELEIFNKVLLQLGENVTLLQHPQLRSARKAFVPLTDFLEKRKFGGMSRKKYLQDKQLREEKRARVKKKKMLDQKYINTTALRRERMENLQKLLQANDNVSHTMPLIADGVASSTETMKSIDAVNDDRRGLELQNFRSCYTCKSRFDQIHSFYDQLCPSCAELNFEKRFQTCNLQGKVALVTGGRVKIGFQVVIKLLEAGAFVIVTTRFPKNAAIRFTGHPSFDTFRGRLQIYGLDFRDLVHLEEFVANIREHYHRLDIIVHNACQTIRRPPKYYQHLIDTECVPLKDTNEAIQLLLHDQEAFEAAQCATRAIPSSSDLSTCSEPPEGKGTLSSPTSTLRMLSAEKSQIPLLLSDEKFGTDSSAFPVGVVDVNGQQVDLRSSNSWVLKLGEISTPEVAEVFAINTLTPFIINNRLLPLLEKDANAHNGHKFIVNVSAMEGKFYRYKTPTHPHTNMAKAALNMMTRTCSEDLAKRYVYMNSVDTGWINDENPLEKAHTYAQVSNFQTPIDEVDAAARILDPVFVGYSSGKLVYGKFLKDYHETEW